MTVICLQFLKEGKYKRERDTVNGKSCIRTSLIFETALSLLCLGPQFWVQILAFNVLVHMVICEHKIILAEIKAPLKIGPVCFPNESQTFKTCVQRRKCMLFYISGLPLYLEHFFLISLKDEKVTFI